jgi:hypothetical protein
VAKIYLLFTARQALDEALALLGRKVVAYNTAAHWIGVRFSDACADLACLKRHGIDAEIRTP